MGTAREEEPVTPAGRLFLRPEIGQVIHCLLGGNHPINVDRVKSEITNSMMVKHPRFYSLLVTDRHGREYWKKTTLDVDRHVIVLNDPVGVDPTLDEESVVNDYLADLSVSSPLSTDKPLWEIHILMAHNCAVLRVHHALGDGISLMSMFLTSCRQAEDPEKLPTIKSTGASSTSIISMISGNDNNCTNYRRGRRRRLFSGLVKMVWFTVVYVLEFVLRTLWVSDKRTALSGGAGVELWPRKLATAKFLFDDMRTVKNAVPRATINDVLLGVISSGLSRYLDIRSPNTLQEGLQITGLAMVNLRPQPSLQDMSELIESNSTSLGNKFGVILLPTYYHKSGSDPLHYLKRAKEMIDRKKQSLEPYFSYQICSFIMSILGPKFASLLNYRAMCNTTFTISNMIGPGEEMTIAGNPIAYLRATSTSLPHAITMHMVTYAGRADMQILVAKDIIPDPQVLAKCFEDALLEMKEAATRN